MIVKVTNAGGNFVIFGEINYVEYRDITFRSDVPVKEDVIDFTHHYPPSMTNNSKNKNEVRETTWELWFMNKNQKENTQVLVHPPVYIMNNEGKTIEKL